MKTAYLFLIVLFMSSCSYELMNKSSKSEKQKIIFSTYHYEYAFTEYGSDSSKLSHPLQYIKDSYPITYVLTAKKLIIYKSFAKNNIKNDTLFKDALNKEQAVVFHKDLSHIELDSIASQTSNIGVDDGFQLNVSIYKNRNNVSFFWNNTYHPPLVNLILLTNSLSPNAYKFYPADKELDFIKSLQQMSTTR